MMCGEHLMRAPNERFATRWIAEQLRASLLQLSFVRDLNCRVRFAELARQSGKIFHVRAEDNRLARNDRLDWILPAVRGHTFPDEDNRRDRVPVAKFTGGIEQQTIDSMRRCVPFASTRVAQS